VNARWLTPRPCDWAGDGTCEVIGSDDARAYFGENGATGPALLLRFANGLTVWASPIEIESA